MRKTSIPPPSMGSQDYMTLAALKTLVEELTGQTGTRITKLGDQATLADVVVKVNQIIDKLQR